jgi:hypothetical protein
VLGVAEGVTAGVTAKGVGGVKLGQGKPPEIRISTKVLLTLHDQSLQLAPVGSSGNDGAVDKMSGV